jgi:hypothetical protein
MKLLLAVVVLSICLGYLFGGRLHRLEALRPRWWGLVLLGLGIQFVPLPNGASGMIDSGQEEVLADLRDQGWDKHHLLTDDDQLTFLADVIAVPQPIGQAVSVGDIFVYAGLTWLIVAAMRGWTPSARTVGSRPRGKHRRGATREPEALPDFGFLPPGATTSGTGR